MELIWRRGGGGGEGEKQSAAEITKFSRLSDLFKQMLFLDFSHFGHKRGVYHSEGSENCITFKQWSEDCNAWLV